MSSLLAPAGGRGKLRVLFAVEMGLVEGVTGEAAELVARVAALDMGKASLMAWVWVPRESRAGARRQEV